MLRFLKKSRKSHKSSKKSIALETPTYKTADIGVEDSDGEYLSRKISEVMRPMGLIRPLGQITTTEGVLESQLRAGGPEINSLLRRMPRPRPMNTTAAMKVSVVGCCC